MKLKKLILITDAWAPQINGVVTTLNKMMEQAANFGYVVEVIHPGLFKTIPTPTYPEIRMVINPWKINKMIPKDADSVHIVTEGILGLASRIIMKHRKWFYTSGFHTNFPEYIKLRTGIPVNWTYPIFKHINNRSRAVMVPSETTRLKLISRGFKNVVTWGRGFDEAIFNEGSKVKANSTVKTLVYVGRVSVEKNLVPLLKLSNKQYNVTIVGDGPDRKKLEEAYPLANFVGFKHGIELAAYFRNADVFVFTSVTDTFGVVMLESMACGTPVAGYPVEGPQDAIIEGLGGCLDKDIETAIINAHKISTSSVLKNASFHSWTSSASIFYNALVDCLGN